MGEAWGWGLATGLVGGKGGFDAADAGGRGFFFLDFEMTEGAGVGDVGAAADFNGGGMRRVADGIDGDAVRVAITERAVGVQGVKGVVFVVFGEGDGEIGGNPSVDLVLHALELVGGEFVVNVEVKTQAFGGEVGAFLLNVGADFLLESGEQEVAGGVVFDGLVTGIREAAFEHTFRGGLAALALLGEGGGKLVLVVLREGETHFINFLYREFQREAVGVLEFEEVGASDLAGGASEFLEFFDALGDGFTEGVFFGGEDGEDLGGRAGCRRRGLGSFRR